MKSIFNKTLRRVFMLLLAGIFTMIGVFSIVHVAKEDPTGNTLIVLQVLSSAFCTIPLMFCWYNTIEKVMDSDKEESEEIE